jgi:hypothetical protein
LSGGDYNPAMLRGRRAAIAAALAIAAAAAVTAGCGGGSSTHALALDAVSAAATKTQDAGAARIHFALTLKGQGRTFRMRGTGAIDGTSSEVTFKLGPRLDLSGIPSPDLTKLMHSSLKTVSLEQNGDYVIYLRMGLLSSLLPGGQQWIKLDVSKLGKAAGVDLGSLMSGSQLQPTDVLGMLRSAGAKVQKLGPATVDGTPTTHYYVTIDMAKALQARGLTSPLLSAVAAKMKTFSQNVWIGHDGLVRRVAFGYRPTLQGVPRVAMTMDIYDYGAHVTIAAPPGSQVFDATRFAQQGIGSGLLH